MAFSTDSLFRRRSRGHRWLNDLVTYVT